MEEGEGTVQLWGRNVHGRLYGGWLSCWNICKRLFLEACAALGVEYRLGGVHCGAWIEDCEKKGLLLLLLNVFGGLVLKTEAAMFREEKKDVSLALKKAD